MPNYNPSPATRFKKGQSGNPAGRPKGSRNYRTLFREAYVAIAKDLRLGTDPDVLLVEILKRGIKEALRGNYPFYKDIMDRLYGKPKQTIESEEEKKLLILADEKEV
ncbi:MAG: DUF5681 domain-containing protein [Minisyncoccia bacterium]|jgi:hypothetical protein